MAPAASLLRVGALVQNVAISPSDQPKMALISRSVAPFSAGRVALGWLPDDPRNSGDRQQAAFCAGRRRHASVMT
jgi:hypothetical protein